MDMNFPHDSVNPELHNDMIDLNAVRSSIIANASARQAASETAKKLLLSMKATIYSRKVRSQTAMKARIIFFAKSHNDATVHDKQEIAKGSFYPTYSRATAISRPSCSKYENGVNLNGSNNVKSSNLNQMNGNHNIAVKP